MRKILLLKMSKIILIFIFSILKLYKSDRSPWWKLRSPLNRHSTSKSRKISSPICGLSNFPSPSQWQTGNIHLTLLSFCSPWCWLQFTSERHERISFTIAAVRGSAFYLSFYFFCKINGAGVKELMKQLPNCRGHWCVESYKLARSCGKLP